MVCTLVPGLTGPETGLKTACVSFYGMCVTASFSPKFSDTLPWFLVNPLHQGLTACLFVFFFANIKPKLTNLKPI